MVSKEQVLEYVTEQTRQNMAVSVKDIAKHFQVTEKAIQTHLLELLNVLERRMKAGVYYYMRRKEEVIE